MRRMLTLLVILAASGAGLSGCGTSAPKLAENTTATTTTTKSTSTAAAAKSCTKFAGAIKQWVSTTKRADDDDTNAGVWHAALGSIDALQADLAALPRTVHKPVALETDLAATHYFDYELERDAAAGRTAETSAALDGAASEALKVLKAYPKLIFGSCVNAAGVSSRPAQ